MSLLSKLGRHGLARPKSLNRTEQLLAEPEVQEFLSAAGRNMHSYMKLLSLLVSAASGVESEKEAAASPIPETMLRSLATHPGMIFISKLVFDKGKGDIAEIKGGMVFSLGPDAALATKETKLWGKTIQKIWGAAVQGHKGNESKNAKAGGSAESGRLQTWRPMRRNFLRRLSHRRHWQRRGREHYRPDETRHGATWWTSIGEQLPIGRRSIVSYVNLRRLGDIIASAIDRKERVGALAVAAMVGLTNATSWIEVWASTATTSPTRHCWPSTESREACCNLCRTAL